MRDTFRQFPMHRAAQYLQRRSIELELFDPVGLSVIDAGDIVGIRKVSLCAAEFSVLCPDDQMDRYLPYRIGVEATVEMLLHIGDAAWPA